MHISDRGVRLIAGFEGFSSAPYWDPFGRVWTRGFGETEGIHQGSPHISYTDGLARLRTLVEARYEWAIRDLGVAFNQNQWDALCSFVWNLGAGIFTGSLRSNLQARRFQTAAAQMLGYDHAGGVVLEGLRTRRHAEMRLFLTPARAENPLAVLLPAERRLVNTYDRYSRHPRLHAHGLRVTRAAMVPLRKAIWAAAAREIHAGRSPHEAWARRHRGARYRLLQARTEGL